MATVTLLGHIIGLSLKHYFGSGIFTSQLLEPLGITRYAGGYLKSQQSIPSHEPLQFSMSNHKLQPTGSRVQKGKYLPLNSVAESRFEAQPNQEKCLKWLHQLIDFDTSQRLIDSLCYGGSHGRIVGLQSQQLGPNFDKYVRMPWKCDFQNHHLHSTSQSKIPISKSN